MKRPQYYRDVPFSRLWTLYAAVFCLFAINGFLGDLLNVGRTPYAVVILNALLSGFVSLMFLHVGTRLEPRYFIHVGLLQFPIWLGFSILATFLIVHLRLRPVETSFGIRLAGCMMLVLVVTSYFFFIRFLRGEGREAFRLRDELELAHGIQSTLVPPVSILTPSYEIYGRSDPSEKVGGDLVDAVEMDDGSTVAYVTDIAGHGLQAGILMGMVKTAARTALLERPSKTQGEVLSALMDRLNRVLPGVKEPQMYATFAGFSLKDDGTVFYALAGHPSFLHYRSPMNIDRLSAEQFPLGLLPVTSFSVAMTKMAQGELLIVVTDGVLETCDKTENEFGVERLAELIAVHATNSLPAIAETILASVRAFGQQEDDQTLLLVRKL